MITMCDLMDQFPNFRNQTYILSIPAKLIVIGLNRFTVLNV